MNRRSLKAVRVLLVAAVLLPLALTVHAQGTGEPPAHGRPSVTVASYNVYFGADLTPVSLAQDLPSFLQATTNIYLAAQATNFPERAEAIAAQIAASDPLLVGLQEATLWRTGPGFDPAPAVAVQTDFLQLILDELLAAGVEYAPVVAQEGFDVEVPTLLGVDVRLTTSDVLLARQDVGGFKLSNPQAANYATSLALPTIAGPVTINRSWVAVDGKYRGQKFRAISTHLEPIAPPVRVAQAGELLAGPANTGLPVILLGDFNSEVGTAGDAAQLMIDAGFIDTWSSLYPGDPGYTCCQAADLTNPVSSLTERVDLVLFRGEVLPLDAALLGADPGDRTPSGLWPSDHAGIFGVLRVHP